MRRSIRLLIAGLTALLLASAAAADRRPAPAPSLSPADVVRIQLQALQHNDVPHPDAGIAEVYRFASPGNRRMTGSLARFAAMLHQGYAEMIDNRRVILGKTRIDGDRAFQNVDVIAGDGRIFGYVFALSRRHQSPDADCWMTDAVLQRDTGRGNGVSM